MATATFGFHPDPGTQFTTGDEPEIAKRLDTLAKRLHLTIYGLSGTRTPAHSVEVGGSANDPHTQNKAADIAVNSQLRSSAAQLTDAQLASVGLYRPFPGSTEINHVQLKPGSVLGKITGALGDAASFLGKTALPQKTDPTDPHTIGGVQPVPSDAQSAIQNAATDTVKAGVDAIAGAVGADGLRILLYVLLVGGGTALAVVGLSRATGLHAPSPTTIAKVIPK